MTGEITLRGKVLPVGGIKEKVLAAQRYGLQTVILPRRNEADLDDVPETVREKMKFILVDTVDEVIAAALTPVAGANEQPVAQARAPRAKRAPRKQDEAPAPAVM
jgi:ATP-dependent Lon protease